MTPLDVAMLLAQSDGRVSRDAKSGLYVVGTSGDAVALTLAAYESGMKVLAVREKAALANGAS